MSTRDNVKERTQQGMFEKRAMAAGEADQQIQHQSSDRLVRSRLFNQNCRTSACRCPPCSNHPWQHICSARRLVVSRSCHYVRGGMTQGLCSGCSPCVFPTVHVTDPVKGACRDTCVFSSTCGPITLTSLPVTGGETVCFVVAMLRTRVKTTLLGVSRQEGSRSGAFEASNCLGPVVPSLQLVASATREARTLGP